MTFSLLPDWPALSIFLAAALAVGASPGPGMLFAVARGIGQGAAAAGVSVLGLSFGSFVNCLLAAFGLAALIAASELAYDLVRYAGAAYLGYLAVRTLRTGAVSLEVSGAARQRFGRLFTEGAITNVTNPKSALFYFAFVPQFVDPARGSVLAQFIVLGLLFNVMGNVINLLVALTFGRLSEWLSRHPGVWRGQQWLTASILGGLAAHLVLSDR